MSGSGNDFVFADGRATPLSFWTADRIREVCNRQTGVGGDGFSLLEPGSHPGAIRFHYFNRDGLRAEMCGNASLCAARLALWTEMAGDRLSLETDYGVVAAQSLQGPGELAEISLPALSGLAPVAAIIPVPGESAAHFVQVGVPHLVVPVEDLKAADVVGRGRVLRFDPSLGPGGANVNFVGRVGGEWALRTYERGVEDETLACGTGSVATAATLVHTGRATFPVELRTRSGCVLTVSGLPIPGGVGGGARGGAFGDIRLRGQGRLVYRAILGQ